MLYLAPLLGDIAMHGRVGASGAHAATATDAADARSAALQLMSNALGHLDSDASIPPIIGAQLQMAIDALWTSVCTDQPSTDLH